MEIQQPNEHEGDHPSSTEPTNPEIRGENSPRIYVASLSDYNDGLLHGEWVDADTDPEDIFVAIHEMLDRSPSGQAEEFAIFDFEGFGPWRPGEYEPIAMIAAVAQGIAEHGVAFAHWVDIVGTSEPDALAGFEAAYLGHWRSVAEYAEELVAGCGLFKEDLVPEAYAGHVWIDYEGIGRDMELYDDIVTSEGDGGVYVFEGHR